MQSGKFSVRLIVCALIAIATSVALQQVLARQREAALKSCCQSNLKCLAQHLKMYADDYNGQLPSSCLVNHSKVWNARDFLTFATFEGDDNPDPHKPKRVLREVLHDYRCCKAACPSDLTNNGKPDATASYWYKLANDKAWYGMGCPKPRRHMADYGYESDQIAFYEHLGWHFADTKGLHSNVQINVSYIDTHVETVVLKNATSGDPLNCAANSDGEPMYYNTSVTDQYTGKPKTQPGPATLTDPTHCYDLIAPF